MMTPTTPKTASQRWDACRDHLWNARGMARVVLEMAWGCSENAGPDDLMRVMFLHAADLRLTMEVLVEQLLKAEDLLGHLEQNICEDED